MKITIHNELSLNSSITGFENNLANYYELAGKIKHSGVLVGSNTAESGIKMFYKEIPKEEKSDFVKKKNNNMPYFILIDSKAKLKGLLHIYRRMEYSREVIVLLSKKTPKSYIEYLKERNYDYIITGEDNIDIKEALKIIEEKYKINKIRVDSGRELNDVLLKQGLAQELSLIISPVIVGENKRDFFINQKNINLNLLKAEKIKDYLWLLYRIKNSSK
ncbi:MAG: dihydrofolate reductase family protein [Candidatus Nanoarchaeia archaeon]